MNRYGLPAHKTPYPFLSPIMIFVPSDRTVPPHLAVPKKGGSDKPVPKRGGAPCGAEYIYPPVPK